VTVAADTGKLREILGPTEGLQQPAWSADGKKIAFASNQGLESINRDGSSRSLLFASRGVLPQAAAYSPDGKRVAFVSLTLPDAESDLRLVDLDIRKVRLLAKCGDGIPRWSPDGRYLMCDGPDVNAPQVLVYDLSGGKPLQLPHGGSGLAGLGWSPDGRYIIAAQAASILAKPKLVLVTIPSGDVVVLDTGGALFGTAVCVGGPQP
jgi:dipeptidyl aminopeptidase/acylaminoacyl peptidase